MPIGLPIIVSVTDLDPNFYPDEARQSDNRGPDTDAGLIRDLFAEQERTVAGMLPAVLLGTGPVAGGTPPTRAAFHDAIKAAAAQLQNPRDTLFIYYAGHGTRLADGLAGPGDRNAICLLDGFFLDVEIVALWHSFSANARVVTIMDCCHAADIATTTLWDRVERVVRRLVGRDPRGDVRSLMDRVAHDIALDHVHELTALYEAAAENGGTDVGGIPCTVLDFAACADEEVLPTEDGRSKFALNIVTSFFLNANRFQNYRDFADDVVRTIESNTVNPVLNAAGRVDDNFENATPPFTLP